MECKNYLINQPSVSEITDKPESICPVDWAKNVVRAAVYENCGKSVVCRDGMKQIYTIINDITQSRATSSDIDLLKDLCETVMLYDGCIYAHEIADMVQKSINSHCDEWAKHILRKRCTALACKSYYTVHVDPVKCQGGGACLSACAYGAVLGGEGLISVIDNDKCIRCEACFSVCSHGAIAKAGAIKPKGPQAPIPVGSFGAGEETGGRRRRRKG